MLENSERSVRGVRMGKSGPLERAELANQIQGFGIRTAEMLQKKKILEESQTIFTFSAYTDACTSSCKIVVASKRPLILFVVRSVVLHFLFLSVGPAVTLLLR